MIVGLRRSDRVAALRRCSGRRFQLSCGVWLSQIHAQLPASGTISENLFMKSEARDSLLEPNRQQTWVEWVRAGVF